MRSLLSIFVAVIIAAGAEAGVVCSVNAISKPIARNYILTWTCNKNPYASRQTVHFENPRGFNMNLISTDGANRCTGGALSGNTEGTYVALSLTNLTFFNVPCTQVPCCIRIGCAGNNAEDCDGWKMSSVFSNDLASTDPVDVANYTTDEIGI